MRSLFAVEPDDRAFEEVLARAVGMLREKARLRPEAYAELSGSRLEGKARETLERAAEGTAFEGTVELVSGQRFPDIVVGGYYGVEVKTTKSDQWKSTGSSVAEGTRVEGVERVYLLFGKMGRPADFRFKPYEDCLAEVVVTHSPRYAIDMDLPPGGTIFDKLGVPYDELRRQENPIRTILDYYRSRLKPGEEVWWLDRPHVSNIVIRMWQALPEGEQLRYRAAGFAFFPEILGNSPAKFQRFTMWLATHEGVVCHNIRDKYTSAGRGDVRVGEEVHRDVPKVLVVLGRLLPAVRGLVEGTPPGELAAYWGGGSVDEADRWACWRRLAARHARTVSPAGFPLEKFLDAEGGIAAEKRYIRAVDMIR